MAAAGIFVPPAHSELALTGAEPGAFDWSSYKEEMESARHKKLKHIAMAFVLTVAALEPHSGLGVLWIGVVGYALFILVDWPASPRKRADARADADYGNAEAEGKRKADALLIEQLAGELGLPKQRTATVIVGRRGASASATSCVRSFEPIGC